ncbi:unnamed protein product [Euphydryas editha]|uniref:SHSP domain-containing protein n=1 Tax=Euphydryas editha TaxID=104508 RepID=A0AAU9USP7_EUPED|nr:unnamed protein product [Euphydryas editha]
MTAIVLFALLACASAAPHFYDHHQFHNHHSYYRHGYNHQPYYHHQRNHKPYYYRPDHHYEDMSPGTFMDSYVFHMKKIWEELQRGMMEGLPKTLFEEKIEENNYKITIYLPGFEQNEIAVTAKKGLLTIQAIHKVECGLEKNYLDVRILPEFVDVNGTWTFEDCLLTIVFPLVGKSNDEPVTTEVSVTQEPEHNTEVVDTDQKGSGEQDTDDGIIRGDQGENNTVSPDGISPRKETVETTTYPILRPIEY